MIFPLFASQIHLEKIEHSIENSVKNSQYIVVAKNLKKTELYYEKKFPKETHYQKSSVTIYQEHVQLYEVKKVIKGSADIGPGKIIKIWSKPEYSEGLIQKYHEEAFSVSLSVIRAVPKFPISTDEEILFLRKHKDVFTQGRESCNEGIGALKEIKKFMKR